MDLKTPLVSVIITCYNQALFLKEAIESARSQTCRDLEIIVVDDGSTDETSEIAASFPEARYIRQSNQGLSAARNTGIRESKGRYLVFLDADDRLHPLALETNLNGFRTHPCCALVFGAHRHISASGEAISPPKIPPVYQNYYQALLQGNFIAMHAAVMYRREALEAIGNFNTALKACEDYDLYLRIAARLPLYGHDAVVAEYRKHQTNMSKQAGLMLKTSLAVLRTQRQQAQQDSQYRNAYRAGIRNWQAFYGPRLRRQFLTRLKRPAHIPAAIKDFFILARYAPQWLIGGPSRKIFRAGWRRMKAGLFPVLHFRYISNPQNPPRSGAPEKVDWGSFRRTTPAGSESGSNPALAFSVGRYYSESFLYRHRQCIRGSVLEIGDKGYSQSLCDEKIGEVAFVPFGKSGREQLLFSELKKYNDHRSGSFDCIILLQVLNSIYDMKPLLKSVYGLLKPGGVLLATLPGIGPFGSTLATGKGYWYFTRVSARSLFAEVFPAPGIAAEAYGNVLAAMAALHGLPATELLADELDFHDPAYPLIIAVRALKPENALDATPEMMETAGRGRENV